MTRPRLPFAALAALASSPAAAHPGHGDPSFAGSWLHYLLEPEHAVVLVLALAGCALAVAARRARRGSGRVAP
jgi:hypothetical protein